MRKKELAVLMNKHDSEISKWVSGTQNFTIETLSQIEHYLEVDFFNSTVFINNTNCNRNQTIKIKNMIYKLTFEDGRIDWCIAKDQLHLLKSYDEENNLEIKNVKSIEEITDEEAKSIMVRNTEFDEDNPNDMPEQICLLDLAVGTDFTIIASTEFD